MLSTFENQVLGLKFNFWASRHWENFLRTQSTGISQIQPEQRKIKPLPTNNVPLSFLAQLKWINSKDYSVSMNGPPWHSNYWIQNFLSNLTNLFSREFKTSALCTLTKRSAAHGEENAICTCLRLQGTKKHTLTHWSGVTPLTVTVQDVWSNNVLATLSRGFTLDDMLTGTCQW